jgi:RNA polymerase sigma-70 factor (ECF subfamily)
MKADKDEKYVMGLKLNDYHAFDFLYHKYSESLYSFVLGITRDSFAAEEVTQIVFIKVWQKKSQIKEYYSFKSFLFRSPIMKPFPGCTKRNPKRDASSNWQKKGDCIPRKQPMDVNT